MLRVLKKDGIIYMAIPDKRFTFDHERPVTPFEHILGDYKNGPAASKQQHFEEWVRFVKNVTAKKAAAERTRALIEEDYSIHFHVWAQADMLELFTRLRQELSLPISIEFIIQNNEEVIFILRKTAPKTG
jgi:hypothetical protein